jgi:hypothetical protein
VAFEAHPTELRSLSLTSVVCPERSSKRSLARLARRMRRRVARFAAAHRGWVILFILMFYYIFTFTPWSGWLWPSVAKRRIACLLVFLIAGEPTKHALHPQFDSEDLVYVRTILKCKLPSGLMVIVKLTSPFPW